ncbi:spore cortex biosynthesis protein YabQ [Desulfurispora thermophila]|uniref:spore cortex biosynthesis protein YabQ n=1 Tax=Desulfurispora thermophila TaxID=265470 RepID=UPI00036A03E2|nr:spore cortex biosynthesis protein YabQ [Desulfurispora thermophila]
MPLDKQLFVLVSAVALGWAAAALYHFWRELTRSGRRSRLWTALSDLLVWLLLLPPVFAGLVLINDGQLRLYVLLLLLLGAVLYYRFFACFLGRFWRRCLVGLARVVLFAGRLIGRAVGLILWPVQLVAGVLSWPLRLITHGAGRLKETVVQKWIRKWKR